MIKRYDPMSEYGFGGTMEECTAGDWVKYADIEEAIKEAYANGKKAAREEPVPYEMYYGKEI